MSKIAYRVSNWNHYNQALVQRGSLTLWLDPEMVKKWDSPVQTSRKGRPASFHPDAILTCLIIRYTLGLPFRQTEGFIDSLFKLMGSKLCAPDYSWLCKQSSKMGLEAAGIESAAEIAIDSSGFKISGEGEWTVRTHGKSKRRQWIKLHIAVDTDSHMITASLVTPSKTHDSQVFEDLLPPHVERILADGAYDSKKIHEVASNHAAQAIIPPRANAVLGPEPQSEEAEHPRDALILLKDILGDSWSKTLGYNRRVHAEGAFSRIKRIFGDKVRGRKTQNQIQEMITKIAILNRFTGMGLSNAVAVP